MDDNTNTELLDIQLLIAVLGTIANAVFAWTIIDILTHSAYPVATLVMAVWFAALTGGIWFMIKAEAIMWAFVMYGIYWVHH